MTAQGELIAEHLSITSAFLGERLTSQMSLFSQQVEDLTQRPPSLIFMNRAVPR
jgi:hypothetical protein